jgi:hypothetical protein
MSEKEQTGNQDTLIVEAECWYPYVMWGHNPEIFQLLTFGILTVVTTKKSVLGTVATESGRRFLTFRRKVLSPSSLFHHDDGGSMFLLNTDKFLPSLNTLLFFPLLFYVFCVEDCCAY